MLKRRLGGPVGLSVVLFTLLVVVPVTAQIPQGGVSPGAASADSGLGGVNTISGTLVSSTGQRIDRRMSIRLRTLTRGDRLTTSDEKGNFVFYNVPSGDFQVVIDKEKDFEPFTQTVSVIQPRGMPPQSYYLSVRLVRKATEPIGKPSVINVDLAKVPKPALDLYNKAVELSKTGDHSGAVKQLEAAIAEYPNFMLAYNAMGVEYLSLNQLEKADEALGAALKIDSQAFMPLMNRGIVVFTMKRYGEAVPILRKALAQNDQSEVSHYFLGQALANLGLFEDAEKELVTALKFGNEKLNEGRRLLAIIYASRGAKKQAADELETYLKLAPTAADAEKLREKIRQLRESQQ